MPDSPASPEKPAPDDSSPGSSPAPAASSRRSLWKRLRIARWLFIALFVAGAYTAWREYDFRQAIAEAQALEWKWEYDDPLEAIRKDWSAAFRAATWRDGKRGVWLDTWRDEPEHRRLLHRLAPRALGILDSRDLRDLSAFAQLPGLRSLHLDNCWDLENVDALRTLPGLKMLVLGGCHQLTSVEPLRALRELEFLHVGPARRLTNAEAVASLSKLKDLSLNCESLTELPALGGLGELTTLNLICVNLQNAEGLRSLPAVQSLTLDDCYGLNNVDAIKSLKSLQRINLSGSTAFTHEQWRGIKAALPGVQIYSP